MGLLADQWTNLATVSRARQNSLGGMVSNAITNVTAVRGDGFDVAEDWSVTDRYNYPKAFAAITDDSELSQSYRDQLTQLQTSRGEDAKNNTVLLQRLARDLGIEDAATSTDIRNTLNAIEQLSPASTTELTPGAAEQDGKAIADGTATNEEIARITERLAKTGLTPDQLQDLEDGKTVDLPPGELAYLQAFYGYAGKDGLLGLSEQLEADGSPEAHALQNYLANGILTLSQEKIVTRDKDGNILDRGGMDKLDPEIQELIQTRPSFRGDNLPDATTPGLGADYQEGGKAEWVTDVKQFGNLLSNSSIGYDPGTKLGVELTRQGANLAGLADHGEITSLGDDTITQYLDVGSRNEDSNYALLTGKGTDEIPGNGDLGISAEELLGVGYQRENVMTPLMTHEWQDDGTRFGEGMFGWIPEDAKVLDGQDPSVANLRAGESAYALSQILSGDEYKKWLDTGVRSGEDQSLGQINPKLTQEMAEALAPYAGNLVGLPDDYANNAGFGDLGGPVEAVRLLSVLDGDDTASTIINGALLSESMRINEMYASMDTSGQEVSPKLMGEYASRLTWAVEQGIDTELAERETDKGDRATKLNAAYTAAQIGLGGISPGAAAAMALTAFPQAEIVDTLAGGEQQPHEAKYFEGIGNVNTVYNPTTDGTDSHRNYAFLQSLVQQGTIDVNTLDPTLTQELQGEKVLVSYTDYQDRLKVMPGQQLTSSTTLLTDALTAAGLNDANAESYLAAATNQFQREKYSDVIAEGIEGTDAPKRDGNTWVLPTRK
ncbi:hypothetical protein HLB23_24410 [Nocardia uniformis]|uniref:TPR repeat domain-containing protein n=1 Tax=Nocardia uniformis TaxID=53432 RepID=A0A849C2S4_9NOCA|nr:hypothetical protein [Nocardia uniformis]NNH72964.1 hypothetical protein [Nocardia uniformis]